MGQQPNERKNCSGKQARVSELRRQGDSRERWTPRQEESLLEDAYQQAGTDFRHSHTALSMGFSALKVVPP